MQPAAQEVGQVLGELSRTARSVLQPLFTIVQCGAARLNDWIIRAVALVPPERLVEAKPSLLAATIAAIGKEDDGSEMRDYYVTLLASLIDSDRQAAVHPAFPRMLQELSPVDARLLQITPFGSELSLPNGLGKPPYNFDSGLMATWESWKEGSIATGRYRFFRRVVKKREAHATTKGVDHIGFLEPVLSQRWLFQDQGVCWWNLKRLGLVSESVPKDRRGNMLDHFAAEPVALPHFQSLLQNYDLTHVRVFYRTELGNTFARCCVPVYTGKVEWHPYHSPSKP